MPIDPNKLYNWQFPEIEQNYTVRDSIIYAVGLGFGADPLDEGQLPFVFEERPFQVVPTMAAVLCTPGFWLRAPETGVDWEKVLHGEMNIEIHNSLRPEATVVATNKVVNIVDKGRGKGALLFQKRVVTDKVTGTRLATLSSTTFARGDGGCGGDRYPAPKPHSLPDREPDKVCNLPTLRQAALIYRLSGDPNPLHADPKVAALAGFNRPILHGLCTLGVAGHAILRTYCSYDAMRLRSLKLRFSAPVYPGENILTEMWRDGKNVSFRARVVERDVVVLNNGLAEVADG
ncbi:MAG: 3-alpha,7-alpha,12-alpha-trihydroxy-5-beta-cholest-24-enoyl-CoA hydratase [Rhodospirillaceae bacterium TMED8]|nr:3-alpha,7-alpha,12-alpha-trihydroxy-5-beta-cholest-24-enoyl-CoA hydratase [Magnetovibrio sp.]OUT48314.1 MAG: 3-alpha,7-alpha,12-alpha-trihydroxy-5-beta-cholest-24-enoyl-CoA hydratase [Rhodospirillaceae bacterium TMED8]|tara:strand:- start:127 stop:993 length:867 start_codon:yes stop_codon:yes gene_type:complete